MRVAVKDTIFDFTWTLDDAQPVLDVDGKQTGWDKAVSDLTPATGIEIVKEDRQGIARAVEIRNHVASMTYAEVETYIDTNVTDLASARNFLKLLAKAVLAMIKIQDDR